MLLRFVLSLLVVPGAVVLLWMLRQRFCLSGQRRYRPARKQERGYNDSVDPGLEIHVTKLSCLTVQGQSRRSGPSSCSASRFGMGKKCFMR